MLFAVYFYTYDKCGDSEHLAMIWKGSGDRSVKKLFKKILERRNFFEIPKKYDLESLFQIYTNGGFDAVSKIMDAGAIEPIQTNEWLS